MKECIFCKIAKGEIPAQRVYEDENVLAFLDIQPKAPGHMLVVPKEHFEDIFDIPESELGEVQKVVKSLSAKIKERLNPDGIYVRQNSGECAGQTVFHYHVHIVPCYESEEEKDVEDVLEILTR